jgi:hypothetical protein
MEHFSHGPRYFRQVLFTLLQFLVEFGFELAFEMILPEGREALSNAIAKLRGRSEKRRA